MYPPRLLLIALLGLTFGWLGVSSSTAAQEASPAQGTGADKPAAEGAHAGPGETLVVEQEQVADRFKKLEDALLRMAELTQQEDPKRAELLRKVVAHSKDSHIASQLDEIARLLEKEQLFQAGKDQAEAHQNLTKLLELLLSEDRGKRIESEKERIRNYLSRVNRIIKDQKDLQGQTPDANDPKQLATKQGGLAEKTGQLGKDMQAAATEKLSDGKDGQRAEGDNQDAKKDDSAGKKKQGDQKDADKNKNGGDKKDGDKKDADGKSGENSQDSDQQGDKQSGGKSGSQSKDSKSGKKDEKHKDDKSKDGQDKQGDKQAQSDKDKQGEQGEQQDGQQQSGQQQDGQQQNRQQKGKPSQGKSQQGGRPQQGEQQEQQEEQPEQSQEQSSESSARKRIQAAEQRMEEAQKKLEEALKKDAVDKQEEALRQLEQAKAELEQILRQLREEEVERMLALLETRFRKMLEMQTEVYNGTKVVDATPEADRDRDIEIETGRLGRKESAIVVEADKALNLMREEGSAVAFPEAVTQMRDDMEQIVSRLSSSNTGKITQGIEEDVIKALEEMIASHKQAQKDAQQRKNMPQQQQEGEQQDEPLVDKIAELKMIRALQLRVNTRHERYSKLVEGEQAEDPELVDALQRLKERQLRIHRTTRDIVVGRNK